MSTVNTLILKINFILKGKGSFCIHKGRPQNLVFFTSFPLCSHILAVNRQKLTVASVFGRPFSSSPSGVNVPPAHIALLLKVTKAIHRLSIVTLVASIRLGVILDKLRLSLQCAHLTRRAMRSLARVIHTLDSGGQKTAKFYGCPLWMALIVTQFCVYSSILPYSVLIS